MTIKIIETVVALCLVGLLMNHKNNDTKVKIGLAFLIGIFLINI